MRREGGISGAQMFNHQTLLIQIPEKLQGSQDE